MACPQRTTRPLEIEVSKRRSSDPYAASSDAIDRPRWKRSVTVAFTCGEMAQRLRDLAYEWDLYAPDGDEPAVSYVV